MAPSNRKPRARPRSTKRARPWAALRVAGIALLVLVAVSGAVLAYLWPRCAGSGCPSVRALREHTAAQASRVLDRDGRLLAHLAAERRIIVPLEKIPPHVAGAFLAVEDRRFFRHRGVDLRRVLGAVVRDLQSLSFRQGFSTITMQLARNVFPEHLTREKTLRRKVWEVFVAREIEQEFSKHEILEMYLNQIYLGNGLYGVEAAAQGYFGKRADQLSEVEAALLAAIPKAPSTYDPRRNRSAAIRRRNVVLNEMAEAGLITSYEAEDGKDDPLALIAPPEARGTAPYVVAAVRRELRELFGPEADNAGLTVQTAIDRTLQRSAEKALREQLASIERGALGRYRGPRCSSGVVADARRCLQGLFVALDARTGDVLALVGGRDYALSQFDRVTQARRQPGSAFKPFVYAAALASGVPITTHLAGPGAAEFEGGYRPADHVSDSLSLDLRDALRLSSNRATVALGERVGIHGVIRTAKGFGLTTTIPAYPSTFLGAAEVVPLELVSAYTAFANYGIRAAPRLILRVVDSQGRVVYQAPVRRETAITPEAAFLTTSLMQDVVNSGTGHPVRAAGLPYGVPAAGKTGTTNDATDTWFVGVTPDIAAGVWVGFDQPRRIMLGADGGKIAAPVWGKVLASYYQTHSVPEAWTAPIGLVSVTVDVETGMRATGSCPPEVVRDEWFLAGTEPGEYCTLHQNDGADGWFRRGIDALGDLFGDR